MKKEGEYMGRLALPLVAHDSKKEDMNCLVKAQPHEPISLSSMGSSFIQNLTRMPYCRSHIVKIACYLLQKKE